MILCRVSNVLVSQCMAEQKYCNFAGGWTMCSMTKFLQRGGRTQGEIAAWISGSVKKSTLPVDGICSCAKTNTAPFDSAWSCALGTAVQENHVCLGLTTYGSCRSVGLKQNSTEAKWSARDPAYTPTNGAVCCYN
jgi:hypothetical protein